MIVLKPWKDKEKEKKPKVTIQRATARHAKQIADIIAAEIAAAGAPRQWIVYEGAIEASIRAGDLMLYDDADPRTVIWIHPDHPVNPARLEVLHIWGATGTLRPDGHGRGHARLLRRACEATITAGWGNVPIRYPRDPQQALTRAADDLASTVAERSPDGRTATTTANLALVRLIGNGVV